MKDMPLAILICIGLAMLLFSVQRINEKPPITPVQTSKTKVVDYICIEDNGKWCTKYEVKEYYLEDSK